MPSVPSLLRPASTARRSSVPENLSLAQLLTFVGGLMINETAQRLHEFGLTLSDYQVLYQLARVEQPVPAGRVAIEAGMGATTVTAATRRLLAAGLITREQGSVDQRTVLLGLTPLGTEVYDKATAATETLGEAVKEQIPGRDHKRLRANLASIADSIL